MTTPPAEGLRAATLDDLAALNREIAALVRARLPLEEGLSEIARDFDGGPGTWAGRLAAAMSQGMTLDEAIDAQGASFPPAYGAVVRAGQHSKNLAAALDGFAESAARVAELRLIAAQAAVYPLLVAIVAWFVFVAAVSVLLPSYHAIDIPLTSWADGIELSPRVLEGFVAVVPTGLVLFAAMWWRRSAYYGGSLPTHSLFRWIPGASRSSILMGQANFAELLHLLLASHVDLPTALHLAARASGAKPMQPAADSLAATISAGQAIEQNLSALRGLPPLVRIALLSKLAPPRLVSALAGAASAYRERAASWVRYVAIVFPVALTLLLGAFIVGICAVLVFQPYTALLHELSR
jgi:general secretion pathway protein F